MSKFYSFARGLLYLPVKLIFPTKIVGKDNMPLPERVITVTNHLSWTDILLVAINVKGYRHIIAKKELTENKLVGKMMKWAGVIAIDRENVDLSAIKKVLTALKNDESITIFPEGTRNKNGEELQSVKQGTAMFALKGKAQIVPIMLLHKPRVFRRNYVYVAPPVSLAEFVGDKVDGVAIDNASKKIEQVMKDAREYLQDYVENKRQKQLKKQIKESKKREKHYGKQAKLALRALKIMLTEQLG